MMAVDDKLLDALRLVESGGNPNAVSKAGAAGAYQFMPGTAKQFGIDPFNEAQSREAARKYLTQLYKQFGSVDKALLAYNWGPGNVRAYEATGKGAKGQPMPIEAQTYAGKVLAKRGEGAGFDPDALASSLFGGGAPQQPATEEPSNKFDPDALAQSLFAGGQQPRQQSKPAEFSVKNAAMGVVRGARDIVDGGAQLLTRGLEAVSPAGSAAERFFQGERQRVEAINRGAEQDYQQNYGGAGKGFDVARLIGNVAGSLPLAAAMPAGTAMGLGGKTALGAATGGGLGALMPVQGDDFWRAKRDQMASGAVGGAIMAPVAAGVGRMLAPKTNPQVTALMNEGVTPTPGQILGGAAKRAEEGLTSVPIFGDFVRGAQRRAAGEMNTAALNRALAPIGESVPKGLAGREAIEHAGRTLSNRYNAIVDRIGAAQVDDAMLSDLANLSQLANKLPKERGDQLARIIDNEILGRVSDGRMTGEAIKAAESNLGNLGRSYMRAADYDTRQLGTAIMEAQNTLRTWLQRAAPRQSAELAKANEGWANFLRAQRAASYVGADGGSFSAANLNSAIKAMDGSRNKAAYSSGRALMQDLGDNAKAVLGQSVPDSGTPLRVANMAMLGSGFANPMIPLGAAAGGLLYTAPAQRALASLLTQRPELVRALGEQVPRLAGPGSVALSPLLSPLLQ